MELTHGKKQKKGTFAAQLFAFPVSPRRQFRRLFYVCLTVMVLSVALHAYVLYRLRDGQVFFASNTSAEPLPAVDNAKLQGVLAQYSAKAARVQAAQVATPLVAEPNL